MDLNHVRAQTLPDTQIHKQYSEFTTPIQLEKSLDLEVFIKQNLS